MATALIVKRRREAILSVLPILKLLKQRDKTVVAGRYRARVGRHRSMTLVTQCLPHEVHSILKNYNPASVVHRKWTTLILLDNDSFPVFVVSATKDNWGARLLFYTGPIEFKKCICAEARIQGYKLTSHGLWQTKGKDEILIAGRTEESIFATLGLRYRQPRVRRKFLTKARRDEYRNRRKIRRKAEAIRSNPGYYVPSAERITTCDSSGNPLPVAKGRKWKPRYKSTMAAFKRAARKSERRMVSTGEERTLVLDTREAICDFGKPKVRSVPKKRKKRKPYDLVKCWRKRRKAKQAKEALLNANTNTDQ